MDSSSKVLHGVPLSTTQGGSPITAATTTRAPSFSGIRAPLTVDDSDFEFSNGPGLKTGSFYSSSDSEGYVSGEDDFETASERPLMPDLDDETFEDTSSVNQYAFPSRPLVRHSAEEFGDSRPFLNDADEEEEEEEEETNGVPERGQNEYASLIDVVEPSQPSPVVGARVSGIPIALVSRDSDDESAGSEIEESSYGFSGVIRIPSADVLQRINSAPKVKILEDDDMDGNESESENMLGSVSGDVLKSGLDGNYDEGGSIVADNVDILEDKSIDIVEKLNVDLLDLSNNEMELKKDLQHLSAVPALYMEGENNVNSSENASQLEVVEHKMEEVEREVISGDVFMDVGDWKNDRTAANEVVVLGEDSGNVKLESMSEQENVLSVETDKMIAASESENADGATRHGEVQSTEFPRLSEVQAADEKGYLMNGQVLAIENELESNSDTLRTPLHHSAVSSEKLFEAEFFLTNLADEKESALSHDDCESLVSEDSDSGKKLKGDLDLVSVSLSPHGSSQHHLQKVDGQVETDSDQEEADGEEESKQMFDSAALAALLQAASGAGSAGRGITLTSSDGTKVFSLEQPVELGSMFSTQPFRPNHFGPSELMVDNESAETLSEDEKRKLEKLQIIRIKYLRLVHRLGQYPEDSVASQVLYRLALAGGMSSPQVFSLDSAKKAALELEVEGENDLNFSVNILVIGKSGVGKTATINSIIGEAREVIDAFEPATTVVKEIISTFDGVKVRILDTPGFRSSPMEQSVNRKVLLAIKKFTKRCPPDVVLYVDRLDVPNRDLNDLPLLKSISSYLGSSIWHNSVVTLTHATTTPPDGPSGHPLSHEMFVAQRSRVIQQLISHSAGNMHMMNAGLMTPVSLVENHYLCMKDESGQKLLPNGESWRSQLLLLCYSMKILSELNSLKTENPLEQKKLFGFRVRSPPLPYFLSSLLQSTVHPKLANDQHNENVDSDRELEYPSNSEDEDEYDQLPPFRPLRKSQVSKLSKEQRKAYYEEYDYRVKLLQKKQWREELKRLIDMKKRGQKDAGDCIYLEEDGDQDAGSPTAVSVPLPDMALPPSFDGDNPGYRYRFLEPSSQLLSRPVLDTHGWDHDCGYDGVSIESNLALASKFPAVIAVQLTKDKKEFNIHLDSSVSAKHGEDGSTMAGLDIQTVGKQLAYILKGETKLKNFKKNKPAAGVSVTFLGEHLVSGLKLEDKITVGNQLVLVGSTGTIRCRGDAAYGANLEMRLREKDYPIGQDQSTLSLSLMKWRGDLVWGCNLESQLSVGRNSKLTVRAGLNNKRSGQISLRTSSPDHLQIALLALLPVARTIIGKLFATESIQHSR